MSRFNILRMFLVAVVAVPVGMFCYLGNHDVPPVWVSVTLMLGYPILFAAFLVIGVWALPQQRPSIGLWFLMRHFIHW